MDEYEMLREYDFRGGVRGKHYNALQSGYSPQLDCYGVRAGISACD